MSVQNIEAMQGLKPDSRNEYLLKLRNLINKIREGDAIWADVTALRAQYGLPEIGSEIMRRGCSVYDEFNSAGWIRPPENKQKTVTEEIPVLAQKEITCLNSDGSRSSEKAVYLEENELNDKEAILKAHGFNPVYFELVSAKNSKWQQSSREGNTKNLYSSKVTVRPIYNGVDLEDIAKHFEHFVSPVKENLDFFHSTKTGRKTVVFGHPDCHFGRYSNSWENGDFYNMEVARKNLIKTTQEFIASVDFDDVKEIVYLFGNDYLNSCATGKTTSQSHAQDNDGTFDNIFKKAAEAMVEVIDMLSTVAPVRVVLVNGNHCRSEETQMALLLEAYYRTVSCVTVNASPIPRKYIKIGNTLLGLSHGSDEKERINGLMQVEAAEDWGATKNHYWLLGHLHHNEFALKEQFGVTTMVLRALTKMDRWSEVNGYTMAQAGCTAFIFDEEEGLKDIKFFLV